MELWNDYEGKLLDGKVRLDRLIGPKGRSAFFTTHNEAGEPATVRVIESLNDEDQILGRWTAVQRINAPTLVRILACNKTVVDGVHLVYAVLESTDAELADLLRERPLTPDETRQMAASVVSGLEALHANGMIHEHVDAESVLARGEEVKLRGDCVREAPEGAEGETLKRRDAHDFAMLVGYALTQRRDVGQAKLPRPFDELVRNGMSGTWGLKEMGAVVRPVAVQTATPAAAVRPQPQPIEVKAAAAVPPTPVLQASPAPARPVPVKAAAGGAAAVSAKAVAESLSSAGAGTLPTRRPVAEDRILLEPEESGRSRTVFWAGLAAVAVLLVALIWHFTHVNAAPQTTSVTPAAPAAAAVEAPSAPVVKPGPAVKPSAATGSSAARGGAGSQWRVVAYTFNREDAARKRAEEIDQRHPALKAEVFTPSGRAPYLVALGGWMSADQAAAMKAKARADGLPRDVYTQNYRGR